MKKTALIIQPGAFGDIIICAPIAKWYYDKGYEVIWPVQGKYFEHLKSIVTGYASPVLIEKECTGQGDWLWEASKYAREFKEPGMKVLELSDRCGVSQEKPNENFEQYKYRIAEVPFEKKHHLYVGGDIAEHSLYQEVVPKEYNHDYTLVHLTSSDNVTQEIPEEISGNVIHVREVGGYNICDWRKVALKARAIYCVESSFHCFIDGILHSLEAEGAPVLVPREGHPKYTVSKGWECRLYESN